jgi:hypothetical protein
METAYKRKTALGLAARKGTKTKAKGTAAIGSAPRTGAQAACRKSNNIWNVNRYQKRQKLIRKKNKSSIRKF